MLFGILLTIQIIICVSMGGLILIQRSEGGALGMGGGPSGFMSARGAGNLLTRMTGILAFLFFANSIGLTIAGNFESHATSAIDKVDTSKLTLDKSALPAAGAAAASSSTSSAPSLSDLPLATTPTLAPVTSSAAPTNTGAASAPAARNNAALAPLNLPAVNLHPSTSAAPLTPKQVEAAQAKMFSSSSSSKAASSVSKAPASASASVSKTANVPAAPSSSTSSAPH